DQVWVTVVATGYGDKPLTRAGSGRERESTRLSAREADREPRVSRVSRDSSSLSDLSVPEFVPKR
ncbi:MAG: cell division protein FtsZ, partial [Thermoleophilaceae bacterium]